VWGTETRVMRAALALWGASLAASALLKHRHHVADVLVGAGLAWALISWRTGQGPAPERS
jgi:membrane-associated phospholipid phosphatase